MEAKLKKELGTTMLKSTGHAVGGCISEGQSYDTDHGRVFVKINHKSEAKLMFDGEMASLEAILKTETVKVPKPMKVLKTARRAAGGFACSQQKTDGKTKQRAANSKGARQTETAPVEKYGFGINTCCGYIAQENEWQSDWVLFYSQQKLQHQLNLVEKSYGDREARELWAKLQLKIPEFFTNVEIVPALLHGDLWGGNTAECADGLVIFDPASFYGHSEFELAIAGMFGGFNSSFYSAYHDKIPQAPGFAQRSQLYQLFHYLNHWNHFGGGYRGSSIRIMKNLLK
ncbi:ketosamine-3-kinase-like isoform X2 [Girardinichthys multiradiatus]|uniref:ketosamine-3-kinase-like isoform X2 n=1 Tax=Girardinichthys multiradiatus TaxID=208333 RepID=UPI001FAB558B|nr:ketosamine-3-kinase-like isoform X2 [Girardinichthys multiradiatus]